MSNNIESDIKYYCNNRLDIFVKSIHKIYSPHANEENFIVNLHGLLQDLNNFMGKQGVFINIDNLEFVKIFNNISTKYILLQVPKTDNYQLYLNNL